jgi:hypothetical protein
MSPTSVASLPGASGRGALRRGSSIGFSDEGPLREAGSDGASDRTQGHRRNVPHFSRFAA